MPNYLSNSLAFHVSKYIQSLYFIYFVLFSWSMNKKTFIYTQFLIAHLQNYYVMISSLCFLTSVTKFAEHKSNLTNIPVIFYEELGLSGYKEYIDPKPEFIFLHIYFLTMPMKFYFVLKYIGKIKTTFL